jgi:predicted AlkP superfamily phosphohydrolase/phosphomutase
MPIRGLASAALVSSLLAGDLVVLTLFLNPEASLRSDGLPLLGSLFLPYAILGAALFSLIALLFSLGRKRMPRPIVPGLPFFTPFAIVSVLVTALLFWGNLWHYRFSIPVPFVEGLAASGVCLTVALLVLVGVAVDALVFPRGGRGLSAALVVLAAASSAVLPLALLPVASSPAQPVSLVTETVQPLRRVILVGVDGLGFEQIERARARGTLGGLQIALRRGSSGSLATLRPTEGPPVWTTILTGRLPRDHGVKSFGTYRIRGSRTTFEILPMGALVGLLERAGLVTTVPVTSASRKRRALWNDLNAFGIQTGVVRFWGTLPPERVRGFMLAHPFHLLAADAAKAGTALYPDDLLAEVRGRAVAPADVDRALLAEFVDFSVDIPGERFPWRRELVERALAPDLTYQRAGAVLRAAYDPPFFATYFYGLDVVGHSFTRFAEPDLFGNVRPQEVRRYGRVVDRYVSLVGQWVGEAMPGLRKGEILMVVSGYGMEPSPFWRRLVGSVTGRPVSGTHVGAPDGLLIAAGDGIRPGATLRNASVLDVAPTILYLMGLPIARDMEGRVLTEMLEEGFLRAHPVAFIPSYESLAVTPAEPPPAIPPSFPEDEP